MQDNGQMGSPPFEWGQLMHSAWLECRAAGPGIHCAQRAQRAADKEGGQSDTGKTAKHSASLRRNSWLKQDRRIQPRHCYPPENTH